tara:strand:+ start:228 stop:836 length:609 start_codon:yes stop_codon:yes gene_type:complete
MKKQIFLQENLLKKILKIFYFLTVILFFLTSNSYAKQKWMIDKNISQIKFEVPVLLATNVFGEFENFDGFVEIDLENKKNNKAIFSVNIDSIKINYQKYKNLILSPIFFDQVNYPIAVIDTKRFSYEDEKNLSLNIEVTIKGISKKVNTQLKIIKLTNDIVQIFGELEFNRNDFNIGVGNWKNTSILKSKIKINANIFLIKE